MATSFTTREGRQKILEGLWLIGIEPGQLAVDPNLEGQAFLDALHRNGVDDNFIGRAIRGVDWRAGDDRRPLNMKVADWLRTAGYRDDEITRFNEELGRAGGTNSPAAINGILTRLFNERTAGAVIHKVTGGKPPGGAVWNPFRTDTPPQGVDTKYGGGGILSTALPPGMQSAEPVNPRAQPAAPNRAVPLSATRGVPVGPGRPPPGPAPPPGGGAPPPGQGPGTGGPGPGGPATPATRPVEERLTPEQRRARLEARYGWAAALADIPEVNRILNRVANGEIDEVEADRLYRASDYYKSTTSSMREWAIFQKTDLADAAKRKQTNLDNITNLAKAAGIQNPDPRRLAQINDLALSAGWSDADVRRALAAEVRYDPDGAKTGTLAELQNMTRDWLVPLSDQAMTSWAQSIVAGSKTLDDFREYNRQQAKSLFPGLGTALDDPEMTTRTYLDPYAQDTAQLLGVNADDIDWRDPKYMRAFNQIDPKTNQRTVMSRADWQHTLMNDPMYGFDKTTKGQEMKQSLTQSLMSAFGFSDFG